MRFYRIGSQGQPPAVICMRSFQPMTPLSFGSISLLSDFFLFIAVIYFYLYAYVYAYARGPAFTMFSGISLYFLKFSWNFSARDFAEAS